MERQGTSDLDGDKLVIHRGTLGKLLNKKINKSIQFSKASSNSRLPSQDFRVPENLTLKRHATESAMLHGRSGQCIPDKYSRPDQHPATNPTAEPGTRNGSDRRQINITKVVDKFLLEFMQALSNNEEEPRYVPGTTFDNTIVPDGYNAEDTKVSATDIEWQNTSILPHGSPSRSECMATSEDFGGRSSDFDESSSPPNKKSKQSYRLSRPPLLPPCRVCGDKASGYHYGVNTCEACKGFFRRSICKTGSYVCTGSGSCSTVGGKRTLCSYCRFKRCLEVGMSKDAIKTGRYTHELRSKNILEVKNLERLYGELESSDTLPEQVSRESDLLYAAFQTAYLQNKVLDDTLQSLIEGQKKMYEFLDDYYNADLMSERQLAVYNGYISKTKASTNMLSSHGSHYHTNNTSTNGQSNSSEIGNTDMVHSGYSSNNCANHINKPSDSSSSSSINVPTRLSNVDGPKQADESVKADVMSKIIANMEQSVRGMLSFAKSVPKFDGLPNDDQASLLKAGRFDVWYIGHIRCFNVDLKVGACEWQFHANELAQVWGDDMIHLAFNLSRVGQSLNLTKEETAALRAVCLTFPDRCMDLVERDEVEKMHQHLLDVLKHVACKRMGANVYNTWFSKIINFLMLLREFGVTFEAISTNIKLDWSVLKGNPLLLSVFLS